VVVGSPRVDDARNPSTMTKNQNGCGKNVVKNPLLEMHFQLVLLQLCQKSHLFIKLSVNGRISQVLQEV
jgi:hypothetical protein